MTDVSVVVPWLGGCEHREKVWEWVQARYQAEHPEWEIVAAPGSSPWVKAAAVAAGLRRAGGDIIVIADADVWCDTTATAVAAVHAGHRWAVPHRQIRRLNQAATIAVLAGGPLGGALEEHPYRAHPGGGITVLTRQLYIQVPLDPRFIGWGHEDDAWGYALTATVGMPHRGNAPLWHLWHPPQIRQSRLRGSDTSRALLRRYARAYRNRDDTAALLAEISTDKECIKWLR